MAYLGFQNISDIEDMGLAEYNLRMEASLLKQTSREREIALQAFLNQSVKETKGSEKHPVPKYTKFSDFFDYGEAIDNVRANYEPDYQPVSKAGANKHEADLIAQRWKKYIEMKQKER